MKFKVLTIAFSPVGRKFSHNEYMETYMIIVVAGMMGTLLMSTFLYLTSIVFEMPFKVVKILGTMLTGETGSDGALSSSHRALTVGLGAHYTIGVLFALLFYILVNKKVLVMSLDHVMLFATVIGLLGASVWALYFKIHRRPPAIPRRQYFVAIFLGHYFFGLGMFIVIQIAHLFYSIIKIS